MTAPVVYVNYGLPPDYARLAAAGVDVRGKIAIARYARSHRAVKLHTAEQAGAAGIIIYSDPADDGFARGLTWPDGPWRADFQSQSGNGKYSWFWHGDPLTPGVGATPGAPALDPADGADAAENSRRRALVERGRRRSCRSSRVRRRRQVRVSRAGCRLPTVSGPAR